MAYPEFRLKIIAKHRSAKRGITVTPASLPAQGRIDFAILLFAAILGRDKSRAMGLTLSLTGLSNTSVMAVCE
ncbi:MAG: hypothetical protein ACXW02_06815 [Halobacteriota archaeon]